MSAEAQLGRDAIIAEPTQARAAFARIQAAGRAALGDMRTTVGALMADSSRPVPVLADLPDLIGGGPVRIKVVGAPQLVPPGVELSGYRVVEHLLAILGEQPRQRADVVVTLEPGLVEISLTSDLHLSQDVSGRLAAAREQAVLHGGSLATQSTGTGWRTVARLPFAVASG